MKSSANLGYIAYLTIAAAIGGLLFGYDAAVISGTIDDVTVKFGLDVILLCVFLKRFLCVTW